MKLTQMTLAQLRKRADKLGVEYTPKTTEEKLIKRIKKAKAAAKADPVESWPEDWPIENRDAYFHEIVGKPMPDDEHEAYAQLRAAIELQAPEAELIRTNLGVACFGLYYTPTQKQCSLACQVMPLCKQICATRPGLKDQIKELNAVAEELEASEKLKPAKKTKAPVKEKTKEVKAKGVKAKAAKSAPERYHWVGDLDAYETEGASDDELITHEIFSWMAGRKKPFTAAHLTKQLAKHYEGDCMDGATAMIAQLMEQGEIEAVAEEAAA